MKNLLKKVLLKRFQKIEELCIMNLAFMKGELVMPNILLTRIDNRMIHGQGATQWSPYFRANLPLVANDKVAADPMRHGLMDMVAPVGAQTRYFTIEKRLTSSVS